jgi:hypothetical protein
MLTGDRVKHKPQEETTCSGNDQQLLPFDTTRTSLKKTHATVFMLTCIILKIIRNINSVTVF